MKGYTISMLEGNGCEIGFKLGRSVKGRFETMITQYLDMVDSIYPLDYDRMKREALDWLLNLPEEYLNEIDSLSYGSGVKLDRIAAFYYCMRFYTEGCTGYVAWHDGNVWVGRNHDAVGPNLWRHIHVIRKVDCIPVILFGQEGDLYSGTGYNENGLWLHYHSLPEWEKNLPEKGIPPYVFLRMALEKCNTINDVENMLKMISRDSAMLLFAVDGRTNGYGVYECAHKGYMKRAMAKQYIAGANHTILYKGRMPKSGSSLQRQAKMEYCLKTNPITDPFADFKTILADPEIEQKDGLRGTVYASVACPALGLYYYACNGFPAASVAPFEEVIIPDQA